MASPYLASSPPPVGDLFNCPVVPCTAVATSMPLAIDHLQASHPMYYWSIDTDFGRYGVEAIIKWLNVKPIPSSPDFTCVTCGNRPFISSATPLLKSHCLTCATRGFKISTCPYPQCTTYGGDTIELIAHLIEKHPAQHTTTDEISVCGLDGLSETVMLHTSSSGFPPGTNLNTTHVCFQCRILLNTVADVEAHLLRTPCHAADVAVQIEMNGRSSLAEMLPEMFIVRNKHNTATDSGIIDQEAGNVPGNDEEGGGRIDGARKRLKISNAPPVGGPAEMESGGEEPYINVTDSMGKRVAKPSNSEITGNTKEQTAPTTPRKATPARASMHKPHKRKRSYSFAPSPSFGSRDLDTDFNIRLIDFDRFVVITKPITLEFIIANTREYMDQGMRRGFKGLTGSKRPPSWTGLSDEAWNAVWDEDLWEMMKRRGSREFLIPTLDVEAVWEFDEGDLV